MNQQALTVRLPEDTYERLRRAAFERGVPMNNLLTEAAEATLDECVVPLRVTGANHAERLRRLVREHGALGVPFPNNGQPTWKVCEAVDGAWQPVNPHAVPSVGVEVDRIDVEVVSDPAQCGYPRGHRSDRAGPCPRCGK